MRTGILAALASTLVACAQPPSAPRTAAGGDATTAMPAGIGVARGFLDRGDLQAAREQALRLVQESPDFVEGWLLLCETLLRLGRVDEAQTVLAAAHRIYGMLPDLTVLDGRVAAALGELPSADGQ